MRSLLRDALLTSCLGFVSLVHSTTLPFMDMEAVATALNQYLFGMSLNRVELVSDESREESMFVSDGVFQIPGLHHPTLCFVGLGASSIDALVLLVHAFPDLKVVLIDVNSQGLSLLRRVFPNTISHVTVAEVEDFTPTSSHPQSCHAIMWSVDSHHFSFYRYRALFESVTTNILAFLNLQGCGFLTTIDAEYCNYLEGSFKRTFCGTALGNLDETASIWRPAWRNASFASRDPQSNHKLLTARKSYMPIPQASCDHYLCTCYATADAFLDVTIPSSMVDAGLRRIYLDVGANWANSLRLWRDYEQPLQRQLVDAARPFGALQKPWEVFAFEPMPEIQVYVELMVSFLNGEGVRPQMEFPPQDGNIQGRDVEYDCVFPHWRQANKCLAWRFEPAIRRWHATALSKLQSWGLRDSTFIDRRLTSASHPSDSKMTRYTFLPAAVGGTDGTLNITDGSILDFDRCPECVFIGVGVIPSGSLQVRKVDIVGWILRSFRAEDFVLLKVDAEGAEWEFMPELARSAAHIVNVIIFECHANSKPQSYQGIDRLTCYDMLKAIEATGMYLYQYVTGGELVEDVGFPSPGAENAGVDSSTKEEHMFISRRWMRNTSLSKLTAFRRPAWWELVPPYEDTLDSEDVASYIAGSSSGR